jgi:hypothetical protein
MMRSALGISCLCSVFTASASTGFAQQAILESTSGDNYAIEIQPESSFRDVVDSINESLTIAEMQAAGYRGLADADTSRWNASKGFSMRVADNSIVIKPSNQTLNPQTQRDYYVLPTSAEKADMSYIANSLSNFSLLKIKSVESSLKKAGDRIERVHPLQFLAYLFTNEETKVSVRNLEGRAWVWKEFVAGFVKSLNEENAAGLVLPYAQDFANHLGIDVNLILPTLQSGKWEQFIVTLIRVVPRQGNSGRYDM